MRATVCVQSNRPETYSDVMAAVVSKYPDTSHFDYLILNDQDDEALLRAIEADLSAQANHDFYVRAGRSSRTKRKETFVKRRSFKESQVIDVTGISKELAVEIFAIALTSGKSVCSLSWKDKIGKKRKLVGVDQFE